MRDSSLVLLWKAPVYAGGSPVSGYLVDYQEGDSGEWVTANEAATANRYLKVTPPPHHHPCPLGAGVLPSGADQLGDWGGGGLSSVRLQNDRTWFLQRGRLPSLAPACWPWRPGDVRFLPQPRLTALHTPRQSRRTGCRACFPRGDYDCIEPFPRETWLLMQAPLVTHTRARTHTHTHMTGLPCPTHVQWADRSSLSFSKCFYVSPYDSPAPGVCGANGPRPWWPPPRLTATSPARGRPPSPGRCLRSAVGSVVPLRHRGDPRFP